MYNMWLFDNYPHKLSLVQDVHTVCNTFIDGFFIINIIKEQDKCS
jgi:hypothetical protein